MLPPTTIITTGEDYVTRHFWVPWLRPLHITLLLGACTATQTSLASHHHPTAPSPEDGASCAAQKTPLFDDLGDYHRPITTSDPLAQRYFDQGLIFLYGFDNEMSRRSFAEASRIDPSCAMCAWGEAMALGPNINTPRSPERDQAAYEAAQAAIARAPGASEVERALIVAVAARYAASLPESEEAKRALDQAYADAMRDVARRFPHDVDVKTTFAESLMDLSPWDLWSEDGQPRPLTPEIVSTLAEVLARDPNHPGANHYFIHAVEASKHPEDALPAAERLRDLVPGIGHLVHMPSHVYIRIGRYHEAALANERAIAADEAYRARVVPGPIHWMYSAHNIHFLSVAAMMEGQHVLGISSARALAKHIPMEVLREMPMNDDALSFPFVALVRFGGWQAILDEPAPALEFRYPTAIYHFARGMAFTGLGKRGEAASERAMLEDLHAAMPSDVERMGNSAQTLLGIARSMLDGAMAEARGDMKTAIEQYRLAVRSEDARSYSEPPAWFPPTRHWLGAALLDAGYPEQAEIVYREDLEKRPENGWALFGLAKSLRAQGKDKEASEVEARFQTAWARADFTLRSSRY